MLMKAKKLIGYTIHATDGDIGEVKSMYFDCKLWRVRYLAVQTGGWLSRRQVLIPTASVPRQNLSRDRINVNLSRDQVSSSPDVDFNLPLSRSTEANVIRLYSLHRYWDIEPSMEGEEPRIEGERTITTAEPSGTIVSTRRVPDAQYLFNVMDLFNYNLRAVDGNVGDIENIVIDDDSWDVRYLLVDTGKFLPGRKVLISPEWVDSINEPDSQVIVDLTRDSIRTSPEYDPDRPVSREYERKLFDHYNQDSAVSPFALWKFTTMRHAMGNGRILRIETTSPAVVHWTRDEWKTSTETRTRDTGMGMHIADLDTRDIQPGTSVHFTFFWPQADHWEGKNYSVKVVPARKEARVPEMAGV